MARAMGWRLIGCTAAIWATPIGVSDAPAIPCDARQRRRLRRKSRRQRQPSPSADGRFVAFSSTATTLVAGDTNGSADVFVKDRQTGAVTRVSVRTGGSEPVDDSAAPDVSATAATSPSPPRPRSRPTTPTAAPAPPGRPAPTSTSTIGRPAPPSASVSRPAVPGQRRQPRAAHQRRRALRRLRIPPATWSAAAQPPWVSPSGTAAATSTRLSVASGAESDRRPIANSQRRRLPSPSSPTRPRSTRRQSAAVRPGEPHLRARVPPQRRGDETRVGFTVTPTALAYG